MVQRVWFSLIALLLWLCLCDSSWSLLCCACAFTIRLDRSARVVVFLLRFLLCSYLGSWFVLQTCFIVIGQEGHQRDLNDLSSVDFAANDSSEFRVNQLWSFVSSKFWSPWYKIGYLCLTGNNYLSRSRSINVALGAKVKLWFINEKCVYPVKSHLNTNNGFVLIAWWSPGSLIPSLKI